MDTFGNTDAHITTHEQGLEGCRVCCALNNTTWRTDYHSKHDRVTCTWNSV